MLSFLIHMYVYVLVLVSELIILSLMLTMQCMTTMDTFLLHSYQIWLLADIKFVTWLCLCISMIETVTIRNHFQPGMGVTLVKQNFILHTSVMETIPIF